MLYLLKVAGSSLEPGFVEGDFVLVSKIPFFFRPIRAGDVIVFNHVLYQTMIKYVERFAPETGEVFVVGTNPDSIDSRSFGPIRLGVVLGKVIWHIHKKRV
jgi:signal peptidase I